MVMLDANIILRYLLNDDEEMASEAERMIRTGDVHVTVEIVAEVIYVLKGVYSTEREDIRASLLDFFDEVGLNEPEVLRLAVETYAKHNLDFPDCVLFAYNRIKGCEIKTFDKKLKRLLGEPD